MTVTTRKCCSVCEEKLAAGNLYKLICCNDNCNFIVCIGCFNDIWETNLQCEFEDNADNPDYCGPEFGPWDFSCPQCGKEALVHDKDEAIKELNGDGN